MAVLVEMTQNIVAENARVAQDQDEYQKRYDGLVRRYDEAKARYDEVIAAILVVGCLSACSSGSRQTAANNGKIQVVTTIFPEYDWVMNILGENPAGAEVTMLLDSGVDLHSYQPTADDILKISTCDLFIYVGGESDEWVDDALQEATNKDMVVINLLDVLGDSVKEEEVVEGMQEEEHEHDHEEGDEHDEDEHEHEDGEVEYDEHVWLSLKNASVLVQKISDAVQTIDQNHADVYKTNTTNYIEKLNALDAQYQEAVNDASFHTLLFVTVSRSDILLTITGLIIMPLL